MTMEALTFAFIDSRGIPENELYREFTCVSEEEETQVKNHIRACRKHFAAQSFLADCGHLGFKFNCYVCLRYFIQGEFYSGLYRIEPYVNYYVPAPSGYVVVHRDGNIQYSLASPNASEPTITDDDLRGQMEKFRLLQIENFKIAEEARAPTGTIFSPEHAARLETFMFGEPVTPVEAPTDDFGLDSYMATFKDLKVRGKERLEEAKRSVDEFNKYCESKVGQTKEQFRQSRKALKKVEPIMLEFVEKVKTEKNAAIDKITKSMQVALNDIMHLFDDLKKPHQAQFLRMWSADVSTIWHTTGYIFEATPHPDIFRQSLDQLVSFARSNNVGRTFIEVSFQECYKNAHAEFSAQRDHNLRVFFAKREEFEFCTCGDQMHKAIFDVSGGSNIHPRLIYQTVSKQCILMFAKRMGLPNPSMLIKRFRCEMSKAISIENAAKEMKCYNNKPKVARRMAMEQYVAPQIQTIQDQNFIEDHDTPFDTLDLTGYLYTVREILATRQHPSALGLTNDEYAKGLKLLNKYKGRTIAEAQGVMDDVLSKLGSIMDAFRAYESAKALGRSLPNNTQIAAGLTGLIADIVAACHLRGPALYAWGALKATSYAVTLTAYGVINAQHIQRCFSYLTKLIKGKEITTSSFPVEVDAHGFEDGEPTILDVIRVFGHVVFGIGNSEIETERARAVQAKFGAINSAITFIKNIKEFIKDILDWASNLFLGVPMFSSFDAEDFADIKRSIIYMTRENRRIDAEMSVDRARELLEKHMKFSPLQEKIIADKVMSGKLRTWLTEFEKFTKLAKEASNVLDSVSRQKPIGICVIGPPGIGKSTEVQNWFNELYAYENARMPNGAKTMYVHPVGSPYFENYHGEIGMFFDEAYASKDPECNKDLSNNLLSIVSSAECRLNMAFEGKGKVRCESKAIVLALNADHFPAERSQLYYPGALARRFILVRLFGDDHFNPNTGVWTGVDDIANHITYLVSDLVDNNNTVQEQNHRNMNQQEFRNLLFSLYDKNKLDYQMMADNKIQRQRLAAAAGFGGQAPTPEIKDNLTPEQRKKILSYLEVDLDEEDDSDEGGPIIADAHMMVGKWAKENTAPNPTQPSLFRRMISHIPSYFASRASGATDAEVGSFLGNEDKEVIELYLSIARLLNLSLNRILVVKRLPDGYEYDLDRDVALAHILPELRKEHWTLTLVEDELFMWTKYGLHSRMFEKMWEEKGGMSVFVDHAISVCRSALYEFFRDWGLVLLAGIGAMAALLIYFLWPEDSEAQGYEQVVVKAKRKINEVTIAQGYEVGIVKAKRKTMADAHMSDQAALEQIQATISDNFEMHVFGEIDGVPKSFMNRAFGIKAEARIVNLHFMRVCHHPAFKNKKLFIKHLGAMKPIPMDEVKWIPWEKHGFSQDFCTVIISTKYLPLAHNNESKFIKEADIDERVTASAYRVNADPEKGVAVLEPLKRGKLYSSRNGNLNKKGAIVARVWEVATETDEYVAYEAKAGKGDCLKPVVIDNPKSQRKFIGYHFAGLGDVAFVGLVTQENIKEFVDPYLVAEAHCLSMGPVMRLRPFKPLDLLPGTNDKHPLGVAILGHLRDDDKDLANFPPGQSKIIRTPLFPGIPLDRMPTKLSGPGVWDKVFEKDSSNFAPVPTRFCEFVHRNRLQLYEDLAHSCDLKPVLSVKEALNSPLTFAYMGPLRFSTSAGYGMRSPGVPGKSAYMMPSLNPETGFYDPSPELMTVIDAWKRWVLEKYEVPVIPNNGTLKDELRMLVDDDPKLARYFRGEGVVPCVLNRVYFGAFVETFYANPIALHHAVGANLNGHYGQYLSRMTKGKDIGDTDISKNDITQWRHKMFNFFTRVIRFMSIVDERAGLSDMVRKENNLIRWALANSIMSNVDCVWGTFWQNSNKMPTGTMFTTLSNCDMNITEQQETLLLMLEKHDPARLKSIIDGERSLDDWFVVFYGDDGYYDRLDWPIEEWIDVAQKAHCRILQDPRKNRQGVDQPVLLSRYEVVVNGSVHWALFPSTIDAIPLWYEKSIIPMPEMLPVLCDAALMEWYHHGHELFLQKKKIYDAELRRVGARVTTISLAKCEADWLEHMI